MLNSGHSAIFDDTYQYKRESVLEPPKWANQAIGKEKLMDALRGWTDYHIGSSKSFSVEWVNIAKPFVVLGEAEFYVSTHSGHYLLNWYFIYTCNKLNSR